VFQREVEEEEEEEVEDFAKVVLAVGRRIGRTQECTADDDDDEAKEEAAKETMLAMAMEQLLLDATAIVTHMWWPRY
jgi:hypothetical protein